MVKATKQVEKSKKIISIMLKIVKQMILRQFSTKSVGRPKKTQIISNIVKNTCISNNKSFDNNENKNLTNKYFSDEIIKCQKILQTKNDLYCGVLDSIEHGTTNVLIEKGFSIKNIIMPEKNNNIFKQHKTFGIKNAFNGSLEEYSHNINKKKHCIGWYFDTCGTISTQQYGIINVVKNTSFSNEAILAFTFCKRGRNKGDEYEKLKKIFLGKLQKILKSKKFIVKKKILDHNYSGNKMSINIRGIQMNTIIFKIQKKY